MSSEKLPEVAQKKEQRQYPPFWERAIPFIVSLIGLLVIALVLVAVLVALGISPFNG